MAARNKLKSGYLQLGAQALKVRVVPKLYARECLYGNSEFDKNVIRLAGDVPATQAVDALLHEITHFLIADCILSYEMQECIAGTMGRGLAGFFRDNPKWVTTISETFREANKCQVKSTHKRRRVTKTRAKGKSQARSRR